MMPKTSFTSTSNIVCLLIAVLCVPADKPVSWHPFHGTRFNHYRGNQRLGLAVLRVDAGRVSIHVRWQPIGRVADDPASSRRLSLPP